MQLRHRLIRLAPEKHTIIWSATNSILETYRKLRNPRGGGTVMMNSITQTAKGALIAGGSYYLMHAHIANRTHLISTCLQDLSYQFRTLDSENSHTQLLLQPTPFHPKPLPERIKLLWNRSILSLGRNAHHFNLAHSTDRFLLFLKSKFLPDSNQS